MAPACVTISVDNAGISCPPAAPNERTTSPAHQLWHALAADAVGCLTLLMHILSPMQEMEGHAIEQGQLLTGPLRPYAFSVNLADVHLDPATGEPMDIAEVSAWQQQHDQASSSSSTASTQVCRRW